MNEKEYIEAMKKEYGSLKTKRADAKEGTSNTKTTSSTQKLLFVLLLVALPAAGYFVSTNPTALKKVTDFTSEYISTTNNATTTVTSNTPTSTAETAATESSPATTTPTYTQPSGSTTPPPTTHLAPSTPQSKVVTAYIAEVSGDLIALDYIAIYRDDDAVPQMIRDGLCAASEPQKCRLDNGVYYQNTDPALHWFTLFPTADIQTWTGSKEYLAHIKRRAPSETPYSITLNNHNQVIKIKEIYKK